MQHAWCSAALVAWPDRYFQLCSTWETERPPLAPSIPLFRDQQLCFLPGNSLSKPDGCVREQRSVIWLDSGHLEQHTASIALAG